MPRLRLERPLAVIGAVALLVVGLDGLTYAATGDSLILGRANRAGAVTTVERTTNGPVLALTAANSTAAPFTTNATGRVDNLFAAKAATSVRLQGKTLAEVTALAKGPTGPRGPQGLRGAPGLLQTGAWAGSTPDIVGTGATLYPNQQATVVVAAGQALVGSMSIVLGTTSGTATAKLGFCINTVPAPGQIPSAPGFWNIPGTATPDLLTVTVTGTRQSYSLTAMATGLPAGTYVVGPCVQKTAGSDIDNNDFGSGWVQVVNP